MLLISLCTTYIHAGHATKSGGSSRSHQQTSKSKASSVTSAGDGPTRTSQRSIKRPRTYDEDNSEFESPPSASKSHSKKSKSNPKGSKSSAGSKPVGSTVPKVSTRCRHNLSTCNCSTFVTILSTTKVL